MYTELLPPVREAATWYRSQISKDERPEPDPVMLGRLTDHVWGAGACQRYDRVREHKELLESKDNWRDTIAGGKEWLVDRNWFRALVEGIDNDAAALEARLRKKID